MDKTLIENGLSLLLTMAVAALTALLTTLIGDIKEAKPRKEAALIFSLAAVVALLFWRQQVVARSPGGTAVFQKANQLTVTYAPATHRMTLKFDGATSTRDKEVWITDISGNLSATSDGYGGPYPFAFSDFSCTSDDKPLKMPFVVRDGTSILLSCEISTVLNREQLRKVLAEGQHKLSLRLASDSGAFTEMSYCFQLDEQLTNELETAPSTVTRRVLFPDCNESSKS